MVCSLVNKGIFLGPGGSITPCCSSSYKFGDIKEDTFNDAFYSDSAKQFRENFYKGKLHKDCKTCIKNKNMHRIFSNNKYSHLRKDTVEMLHVELNLSNTCNLACLMCGPMFSHLWGKELGDDSWNFSVSKDKVKQLAISLKNAKHIVLKGGEPFFYGYIDDFLNQIYDQKFNLNNSSLDLLHILSNGSFLKESTLKVLSKFDEIVLAISIEATGDLYRYIRGDSYTYENVVENIGRFKKYGIIKNEIVLCSTISFWNMDVWVKQHEQIRDTLKNKYNIDVEFTCQPVTGPNSSSIYLKSTTYRKQVYRKIIESKLLQKNPLPYSFIFDKVLDVNIDETINKFNKFRNLDILKINPQIKENTVTSYRL